MKPNVLFLSAFMALSAGSARADVEINETNFPDENFRSFLLEQSYGTDGIITDAEIASVKNIRAGGKNFQSMQGIEFFTALTSLTLSQNKLTSLDISKNTALTELRCDRNQLTTLDVTKNTALQHLYCYENQLTALDVTKNTKLKNLHCSYNPLTALDVSQNTALTALYCYYDQLSTLDVSKNTALTGLQCNNNQLTTIDVSKNTALRTLDCYDNQLTALDVSKNTALRTLQCYKNQIKGAAMDAFIKSLNQPEAGWGELNVIYNENEQNELTATQVAAIKAKNWTPRAFNGTKWEEYAGPVEINETTFPDENFRNIVAEQYGTDGKITEEQVAAVTSIDISGKSIESLQGIEYFTALTSLNCSNNQIKGAAMDALIESLPNLNTEAQNSIDNNASELSGGSLYVMSGNESEKNEMTTTQAAAAKAKGWTPLSYNGTDWVEYAGSTPTAINNVNANGNANDNANAKLIKGGRLVITKDGKEYTAAGAAIE